MQPNYRKPNKFDRDLIVIGGGSAGLVTAYIAAMLKAKVTLIEKNKMGGDCLNTGCVPSKALIRSAKFLAQANRAKSFGFKSVTVDFDFADIMQRVKRIIHSIEPHDSVARYTKLGVECIQGEANLSSPWSVSVNGRNITTRSIVIATGAKPTIPAIDGLADVNYYTSDTIWDLQKLPRRMAILGGGPIGSELAQCFARFGSQVSQIEMDSRLLANEDPEISHKIAQQFASEGVNIYLAHHAKKCSLRNGEKILLCKNAGKIIHIPFDELLIAVGRTANTSQLGLEELGIEISNSATIKVNKYLQTRYPHILACGDVVGPYQFTHMAAHQAWYATINALFGSLKKFKVDYSIVPWATFTDPEIARAGLNESQAQKKAIAYEVTTYDMANLDRAITDESAYGLIKVLTVPGKDKILGATILGEHAGELITEFISAMRNNTGLNKILSTIHIYPTLSEANKFLASNWKKSRIPKKILYYLEKYHCWQRRDFQKLIGK